MGAIRWTGYMLCFLFVLGTSDVSCATWTRPPRRHPGHLQASRDVGGRLRGSIIRVSNRAHSRGQICARGFRQGSVSSRQGLRGQEHIGVQSPSVLIFILDSDVCLRPAPGQAAVWIVGRAELTADLPC